MLLAAAYTAGVAQAQPPDDPPCSTPAGEHNPMCPDGPPPLDPPCDTPAGDHNPKCEDENGNGGNGEEGCPPAGPVTGVIVTIAEEFEAGGGPSEVSDGLTQLACGLHDATGL
ncbi:MAG: hypothetical protein GEU86_02105 [Actinophytocola sp.]|nr:hypothetical protein [Actinophytocola sp.]